MAIKALGQPSATTMKGNYAARTLTTPKIKRGSTSTCAGVACSVDSQHWSVGFTPVIKRGSAGAVARGTCSIDGAFGGQRLRVGFFA